MRITAIKTNKGYFLSANPTGYGDSKLSRYIINGKKAVGTFDEKWIFVKANTKPLLIEEEVSQKAINYRYELIDKSMVTDQIKLCFPRETVAVYDEKEYCWYWGKKYAHLASLYELKYDTQPKLKKPVEFELDVVMEVDEVKKHKGFSYKVQKTQYSHEGTMSLTEKNTRSQLIDSIIFPTFLLSDRPSKLTSKETYSIVRQHIKNNIDPKYAEIASDYNFCFTVKKRIPFAEPVKYTVDVNNNIFSKRKRKPKFVERYTEARSFTVFEMTHAEERYSGYTIINGFEGINQTDLKEKIDFYLENLMETINRPLVDCPTCKGMGVIK